MTAILGVGEVLLVVGFGLAGGGALANWRYRGGLGTASRKLAAAGMRYGTIVGMSGLLAILISAPFR